MTETQIVSQSDNKITLQVTIDLSGDTFLDVEDAILEGCNSVGCKATEEALVRHDTDGSAIMVEGKKLTARTSHRKTYQTPYGNVSVNRYVYQSSSGGRIYCPLDNTVRMIHGSTPRFARMLTYKYSCMNARETCSDFLNNHGRRVSLSFLQNIADSVGAIGQATEERWSYEMPDLNEEVCTVAMSLDGAMLQTCDDGWRESMVGSFSLYDRQGERLHSLYFGASPEYGKAAFKKRFEHEAQSVKQRYADADFIGIADGAHDNWNLLEKYTDHQILDFYHATEYLSKAAYGAHPQKSGKPERTKWLNDYCHILKHDVEGAETVLTELKRVSKKYKLSQVVKEDVAAALTYFSNHLVRMKYADYREKAWPIGSGVTEAACKTLIKQRCCGAGMRWREKGIKTVLSLRSLVLTKGRWNQFWHRIISEGVGNVGYASTL
jgi:hypothetical protein